MPKVTSIDILIIGGGPAGLAAAVAAWDAGCRSLFILERDERMGGILQQCIHSGFGLHYFGESLTGTEYADRWISQVEERDIPYQCQTMVIDLTDSRQVTAVSPQYGLQRFQAGAIILAMGCRERPRGALAIPGTNCAGILTAGAAQRLVNLNGEIPGKRVVILGSGDIGLIMARRMVSVGARVLACVELMPYSSGLPRNVVQCLQDFDIPLLLNHTVISIQGRGRLSSVTIAQVDPETRQPISGTERVIECDTLLLSVGLIPENELSRSAGVLLSGQTQGPLVSQLMQTTVPGIFACGNVLHVHDLVDAVSEEAVVAGLSAVRWIEQYHCDTPEEDILCRLEAGRGIRGLVPQRISLPLETDYIVIHFRPFQVFQPGEIRVRADGQTLLKLKRRVLTPGQEETIRIPSERIREGRVQSIIVEAGDSLE